MAQHLHVGLWAALIAVLATTATARPITHDSSPTTCDGGVPLANHELGNPGPAGFPPDQAIASFSTITNTPACPTLDDPAIPNRLVTITNLTTIAWTDLWFVADVDTGFTNVDILIADTTLDAAPGSSTVKTQAFRIDTLGVNTPLIAESIAADLVFAPGESWTFIVQDWFPVPLDPALMLSIGFAGRSPFPGSNASVIALNEREVPAPAAISLLAAALSGLAYLGGRRR